MDEIEYLSMRQNHESNFASLFLFNKFLDDLLNILNTTNDQELIDLITLYTEETGDSVLEHGHISLLFIGWLIKNFT